MDIESIEITSNDLLLINSQHAWHYRAIPKYIENGIVFFTDNNDRLMQEELGFILGKELDFRIVETDKINKYLHLLYPRSEEKNRARVRVYEGSSEHFLTNLISEAKDLKSSDIHLEVYEDRCRVRIRIDGQMVERYKLEKRDYPSIINKIKIGAGLDIAEKRLPQDGRINYTEDSDRFDIRVSILPTLHGEKIVLRLLNNDATDIDIRKVGFTDNELDVYLESVSRPNGMVLISGPTGSGKTTTLYATLKLLNKETRNILTIEDPIEYTLEGINQVQLKESIGLTFPVALRTFLRQDPDIIMVGEVRDMDTASMAIRASLTGHLVLSTIHTNSAWGTVSRLIDMGVPSFLLANTLNATVAQRLIRTLCPRCKQRKQFSNDLYPRSFKPFHTVNEHFIAVGCEACFYTGYKGRRAIYEVIPIDSDLSNKIKTHAFDVSNELVERNIKTLAENAFSIFMAGETTIEEIYPLLFNY